MTIYSQQLFLGQVAAAQTILYTVPSSTVTVIRDIEICNQGAVADLIHFVIGASGTLRTWFTSSTLNSNQSAQWQGRVVLLTGQTIQSVTGGQAWNIAISGYELT